MTLRLLPRSLVGRVFALYTGVLLVFVLVGLGLFYRYQFTVVLEDAQRSVDTLSSVIVPAVADSAVIGDYDTIRRTLERAVHDSLLASASFIDLAGGRVTTPPPDPPEVVPPEWLRRAVADRLYDSNHTISVGGRDYGVLRLGFAAERIAGGLWQQTRIALLLGLGSVVGGLLLIRFPLVRWLGNLSRIQAFEHALQQGQATPAMLAGDETPLEFRETFAVLGRAAASLQAQRAQAAVTLTAVGDGVFTFGPDEALVLANPAACAQVGRPLEALLGRSPHDILPAVFAGLPPGQAVDHWAGRRVTLQREGQQAVVLDTTLSPILAPDGTVAGHVLACRDMTAQHLLDERLRQELRAREAALVTLRGVLEGLMQRAAGRPRAGPTDPGADDLQAITDMISALVGQLQERGDQLDAIFALSPDGFVSFDARRRANYVSPAFERLTGLAAAEVLGQDEACIEAQLRARGAGADWHGLEGLRRALHAPPAEGAPRRELVELQRPVKRVLELGLRVGSTAAISQVLSLRDITHETEVDQMKSEFLSTAAHELRTPMASIFGYSELMLRRKLRPEQQDEVLATIHRQTALMISIVNELLDLARIEARRGKDFELQTLDLAQLAAEVTRDFKPPQDRARPVLAPAGAPMPVRVDRNKVAQALGNVLSNAYKYSPAGGEVTLRLLQADEGGNALVGLCVGDRGIGMSPEQLARVGERFYRADSSGTIPGTGLGMSIVKEIAELLGGRLDLASVPGEGSAVTIWLPRASAAVASADAVEAA